MIVYLGIGSNLGDRLGQCLQAIRLIESMPNCEVRGRSRFFCTEPVGVEGQDWYVNGVISLKTGLTAQDLLKGLQGIEARMGRERKKKWDPRPIDLDILLYGQEIINEPDLEVPHPLMHLRRFVLLPLAELAPDLNHPVLGKGIKTLLEDLPEERQAVVPFGESECDS